jgi:putative transposase
MLPAPTAGPSFGANALGHRGELITPHPIFLALGPDDTNRRTAYLELFRGELEPMELEEIRTSANAGYALGNERFRKEMAVALGRRAGPGKSGRPSEIPDRHTGRGKALF